MVKGRKIETNVGGGDTLVLRILKEQPHEEDLYYPFIIYLIIHRNRHRNLPTKAITRRQLRQELHLLLGPMHQKR